jgi:hypothetical protein
LKRAAGAADAVALRHDEPRGKRVAQGVAAELLARKQAVSEARKAERKAKRAAKLAAEPERDERTLAEENMGLKQQLAAARTRIRNLTAERRALAHASREHVLTGADARAIRACLHPNTLAQFGPVDRKLAARFERAAQAFGSLKIAIVD